MLHTPIKLCITKQIDKYTQTLHISNLPLEILSFVFDMIYCSTQYPLSTSYSPLKTLFDCCLVCKQWYTIVISKVHANYYVQNMISKRLLPAFTQREWISLCFMAKAALNSQKWSLGPLRLFWIEKTTDFYTMIQQYPNPMHPIWNSLISCTLDVKDVLTELISCFENQGSTLMSGQLHLEMMLKFSERMDLGSFLILFQTLKGIILIRIKPLSEFESGFSLDINSKHSLDTVKCKMVVWDAAVFGSCFHCYCTLSRLQVCSRWYTFQI